MIPYSQKFWGINARLQPFQAIVALEGLKKINNVIFLTALNNNRNLQKILIYLKTYQQISC